MQVSFDYTKGREQRLQILRFLVALAVFICALHVMCMRDAQMALARAQVPHGAPVNAAINPPSAEIYGQS
jgi:hypothetical protein